MNVNPRIFVAFVVGALLVTGSYFLAPKTELALENDPSVSVVSGVAPDRKYIEVKDSDNDGIPDWREQFRYTEPVVVDEIEEEEKYSPPDTLTGKLAIDMLTDTVRARGYGAFGQTQEEILAGATRQLDESAKDILYNESSINISFEASVDALEAYGNKIAEIAIVNSMPENSRNEIEIMQQAVYSEDSSVLEELEPKIEAYKNMRNNMLLVSVPYNMTKEHLDLTNSYNAFLVDLEAMKKAFDDPLYTMVRMKRFHDDSLGLHNAIENLYISLWLKGARWTEEDLVTKFVNIEE